jgi:hypothetical protein
VPPLPLCFNLLFQTVNPITHAATIHLKFRLTRTTTSNTAGKSGEG